jgi:hypothetical protein
MNRRNFLRFLAAAPVIAAAPAAMAKAASPNATLQCVIDENRAIGYFPLTVTGAITADRIAPSAITADKLAVGSITAYRIAAKSFVAGPTTLEIVDIRSGTIGVLPVGRSNIAAFN